MFAHESPEEQFLRSSGKKMHRTTAGGGDHSVQP